MNEQSSDHTHQKITHKNQPLQPKDHQDNSQHFSLSWTPFDPSLHIIQSASNYRYDQINRQLNQNRGFCFDKNQIDDLNQVKEQEVQLNKDIERYQNSQNNLKGSQSAQAKKTSNKNIQQYQKTPQKKQISKFNYNLNNSKQLQSFIGRNHFKRIDIERLNQQMDESIQNSEHSQSLQPQLEIGQVPGQLQNFNTGSNKGLIRENQEGIKLNVRSQLIRRSRKYQISTNNAHKKYINCLKNLFYEALSQEQIKQFERKYIKQKSSRVFFFIILVYVKYRFSRELGLAVKYGFENQMNDRIREYEDQIYRCSDFMLKNYRYEQIHEIEIALRAIEQFYIGNTGLAVQYLYRKDKHIIVKQNHFRTSLKIIQDLQFQYAAIQAPKICKPVQKNHYHRKLGSRIIQREPLKVEKYNKYKDYSSQKHLIQHRNFQQIQDEAQQQVSQSQNHVDSALKQHKQFIHSPKLSQESKQKGQAHQIKAAQDNMIEQQKQSQSQFARLELPSNFQSELGPQYFKSSQSQNNIQMQPDIEKDNQLVSNKRNQQKKNQKIKNILFPPIPPHFYLPDFDKKYGYLFRKLIYVKTWRESIQSLPSQDYANKSFNKENVGKRVPSLLFFGNESFLSKKN